MNKSLYLGAIVLLCFAPLAMAVDYWGGPPPETWNRHDPGSTFQHWHFATGMECSTPELFDNPHGCPIAEIDDLTGWEYGDWEAPPEMGGPIVSGWHAIAAGGGSITLTIPNTPDPNAIKYLFIQLTSSKAPSDVSVAGSGPATSYTSGTFPTGRSQIQWPAPGPYPGSGPWYTYNYGLTIEPNPTSETITITVPECTVIDQIVVDTICIPEPASLGLLVLGSLALLRRRGA